MIHPWIASFAVIPFELDKWVQSTLPKGVTEASELDGSDSDAMEETFRAVRVI
jgi:hypothetical protein